jgi:hypothetical protein
LRADTRANPAKVEDFGDKDLLQDLARILFGEAIPLRRDTRWHAGDPTSVSDAGLVLKRYQKCMDGG